MTLAPAMLAVIVMAAGGRSPVVCQPLRSGIDGQSDGVMIRLQPQICASLSTLTTSSLSNDALWALQTALHEASHVAIYRARSDALWTSEAHVECRALRWVPRAVRQLGGSDFQARLALDRARAMVRRRLPAAYQSRCTRVPPQVIQIRHVMGRRMSLARASVNDGVGL